MACAVWEYIDESRYHLNKVDKMGYREVSDGLMGLYCKKCFHPVQFVDRISIRIPNISKNFYRPDSVTINPHYSFKCPKCGNEENDFGYELDVNITPMIAELNRKGYITKFCCEGHYDEWIDCDGCQLSDSYIWFENDSQKRILERYPLLRPWGIWDNVDDEWKNRFYISVTVGDPTPIPDRLSLLRDWVNALPIWMESIFE